MEFQGFGKRDMVRLFEQPETEVIAWRLREIDVV